MKKILIILILISVLWVPRIPDSSADPWIPIGCPPGEYIDAFTIKDQTAYVITYTYPHSHVYMKENCLDEQSQWEEISSGIELRAGESFCSIDVAVNPHCPDSVTIYVGTDPGCAPARLWKSCDQGSTWSIAHERSGWMHTYYLVVVDPKDWSKVWAATWPGLIVSEDRGENWTSVDPPDFQYLSSICFDPMDPLTVYVSTVGIEPHYGSVFKTTDGGNHWEEKVSGLPWPMDWTTMGADPQIPGVLYLVPTFAFTWPPWGDTVSIYKTAKGGELWERQTVADGEPHSAFRSAHIKANSCYPDIIYLGDSFPGRLYQSFDGGSTWTLIIDQAVGGIVVDKEEPEKIYVAFEDGIRCYQDSLVTVVEDLQESPSLPDGCTLLQNYPNPFNAQTIISYQLPQESKVSLKIYNLLGQRVKTLVEGKQNAGCHQVFWGGQDIQDEEVASGVYFCQLQIADHTETVKIILLR